MIFGAIIFRQVLPCSEFGLCPQ
jgi:hypothetical protein